MTDLIPCTNVPIKMPSSSLSWNRV